MTTLRTDAVLTDTELDLYECPLEGVQMIEASAGTGKTFNICGLYLRLLLERQRSVQEILVVTFTNAATAELRERIRQKIADALACLEGDARLADDPLIAGLMSSLRAKGLGPSDLLPRCRLALASFDEASIFTIHGFCQRALADAPFTAQMPLTQELLQDDSGLVAEVVSDFWRKHLGQAALSPALAAYLSGQKDSPEQWARLLQRHLAKPLSKTLWPDDLDTPASSNLEALQATFTAVRGSWAARRAQWLQTVTDALPQLNANSYKPQSLELAAQEWDVLLRGNDALVCLAATLEKAPLLGAARLAKGTKKHFSPPEGLFFSLAQDFLDALAALTADLRRARLRLIRNVLAEGSTALAARKKTQRVVAFNDMLYNVYARLHPVDSPAGAALARALRQRFPVALVDEFQDTDPLQFAVFQAIYAGQPGPLFMVGDPKQAIYSFRNADLHTYLAARAQATARHTLGANQRSVGPLITALNTLFQRNAGVFMLEGLHYHAVRVGAKPRKEFVDPRPFHVAPRAPLTVWTLPPPDATEPNALKPTLQAAAAAATAAEIADLLRPSGAGQAVLDGRPLRAGDIAILVRTHREGALVRAALSRLHIGSVELSQAGIFQSPDALALAQILAAVLEPTRTPHIYAALATEAMGCSAADILALHEDAPALLHWVDVFTDLRNVWRSSGVGVMLHRWLTQHQIAEKLLARSDGERRLTNILHLIECLHAAASQHAAPDALLHWLHTAMQSGGADDASQLRLESDQNLVQIVTIHRSKGLEYPIVFCPFLWNGRLTPQSDGLDGLHYHDPELGLVQDFRSDGDAGYDATRFKNQQREEQAAEFLRLVYVALTRAVHRCYLVAGCYQTRLKDTLKTSEGQRALLNWMVAGDGMAPDVWFSKPPAPEEIAASWQAFAAAAGPCVCTTPLPLNTGATPALASGDDATFVALTPPAQLPQGWWTGSYSALVHGIRHERGALDHDGRNEDAVPTALAGESLGAPGTAEDVSAVVPPDPQDILWFARGPEAGECLHSVFEHADFSDRASWPAAIAQGLRQLATPRPAAGAVAMASGNEDAALAARQLHNMLHDVLSTPLLTGTVAAADCRPLVLESVPLARRLTELEFLMPAAGLTARRLRSTLQALAYPAPDVDFGVLRGYLKGFIDLVFEHDGRFFIVDWKSNHLGYGPQDYARPALETAMRDHAYHLQYLIYCIALQRYLQLRIPDYRYETHFGGVLYLFIRGVRPAWKDRLGNPTGVYFDRPSAAALERLSALLQPEGAQ